MKKCTKCGVIKKIEEFHRDAGNPRGYKTRCKECLKPIEAIRMAKRRGDPIIGKRIKKQMMNSYYKHREDRITKMRNKSSDYKKESFIKSVYGITLEDYNNKLKLQKGVCAICGQKETRKNKYTGICKLHIDHDHKTGEFRGLLCHSCNFAIGLFDDNIELLKSAINYLNRFKKEVQNLSQT